MTEQQGVQKSHRSNHVKMHTLQEEAEITPTATWFNALLLGIAMKLGGCTIAWNYGFSVGFGEYLVAVIVIGLAYLCLGLCMAEMISIMSFAGGYYGYARCAIGPFAGYIVGCCGVFESTFQMSISVLKIGQFVTQVFETSDDFEPLWWIITYIFVISCHYFGRDWFWYWIGFAALAGLLLIFIYLFGTMPDLDFDKFANPGYMNNNGENFFSVFRLSVLFFLGFDMLTLTSAEVINPKEGVPKAMITLICFLLIFAIWLMVTVASQEPGIGPELYGLQTMFPLVFGYERMFGLTRRMALCICVIPSIATPLGYMYVVGKQVNSMAKSGLLPPIFKHTIGEARTPLLSMFYVVALSLMGLFYAWSVNPYTTLSRFATLAGCVVYLAMFTCYIIFNTRFSNMERSFRNPLGVTSAVIGAMIFSAILIVMIFVNTDYYQVTVLSIGYLLIMTVYYYAYAETHQFFSASEQKVFFKAYIVNMKRRKKQNFIQRIWADFMKGCSSIFGKKGSIRSKVYVTIGGRTSSNDNNSNNNNSNSRVSGSNFSEDDSSHNYSKSTGNGGNAPNEGITSPPNTTSISQVAEGVGLTGYLISAVIKSSKRVAATRSFSVAAPVTVEDNNNKDTNNHDASESINDQQQQQENHSRQYDIEASAIETATENNNNEEQEEEEESEPTEPRTTMIQINSSKNHSYCSDEKKDDDDDDDNDDTTSKLQKEIELV